jgi:hypothetical protein
MPRINDLDGRLYGMMQMLMRVAAGGPHPELRISAPRDVVELQDALNAVLQLAAVIDSQVQADHIPIETGMHAAAMLMVIRDYLKPLPSEGEGDPASVTGDLEAKVADLRAATEAEGLYG